MGGDVWERLWWDVRSERCFEGVDWEVLSEGDVWEVLCGFLKYVIFIDICMQIALKTGVQLGITSLTGQLIR